MFRQTEVLYLIKPTITTDDIGAQVESLAERMVFGTEQSVYHNTYYQAAQAGMKPSKMFEVYTVEYQSEDRLKHNDVIYRIIKAGPAKKPGRTQLTCERAEGDN